MAEPATGDDDTCVFLDGLWLKRSRGGEVQNVPILVAIGVNAGGFRGVAVVEGSKEGKTSWTAIPRHLKEHRLGGRAGVGARRYRRNAVVLCVPERAMVICL